MKILLINVVFGYGSTGIIVENLAEEYRRLGNEVFVIHGRGKTKKKEGIKVYKPTYEFESKICHFISLFSENLYGGMIFSTRNIIRLIKRINPDLVHLHCLNGYFVNIYRLLTFLKSQKFKTILTNHADFMFTANCGYALNCDDWIKNECLNCVRVKEFAGKLAVNKTHKNFLKLQKAVNEFQTLKITCVSPWLTSRIKKSPLYYDREIKTVLNPVVCTDNYTDNPYIDQLKFYGKKRIALFVCNQINNPEKGFVWFKKIADEMSDSDYLFVLVGDNNFNCNQNKNLISFGLVSNSSLSKFYYYADVTLLFSMRETFSMITAESLSFGTQVAGFASGGPESISIDGTSFFVDYGDIQSLIHILTTKINKLDYKTKNKILSLAREKYDLKNIGAQYLDLWR